MDPEMLARANRFSRSLAELPSLTGVVFRGAELTAEQMACYEPGALVEEAGFLSCTRNPARTFRGNATFAVWSVTGRDISPFSPRPHEAEVVFDRSCAFRVLDRSVDPDTGRHQIVLEEVPRDRSAVLGPL